MKTITTMSCGLLAALAGQASADLTITLGPSAPTYATTLNFDEPGGPTGPVNQTDWLVSHGLTLEAGDGLPYVDDFTSVPGQAWLGTGNAFFGNFGVFMAFEQDLTDFSAQFWDPSGPPSPFGGGAAVFLLNDGVEVGFHSFTPSWGGVGDSWLNISATSGDVFDEVRVLGFGFPAFTYMDNASWNAIPAPSSAALVGLGALAATRRRRS